MIHGSSSSKRSYTKQVFLIYFIPSNLFLLLPPMSVSVDIFFLLCFQDDLEYHCVRMPRKAFVGYDQTIANGIGSTSLELVLPQVCPVYNHFLFDLSFCCHISNATSAFQLHSSSRCVVLL
jgi:hypothetical protein